MRSIVMGMSVCLFVRLSVCPLALLENHAPKFHQFFVHFDYGLGSVLFLAALRYVMYFRFVDDVVFSHNGPIWRVLYISKRR